MQIAKVTYIAPDGDSKVVEMGGKTFYNGIETEINSDDDAHLFNKLKGNNNPFFDVEVGEDKPRPKRGRPSNADKAAKADAEKPADPNVKPVVAGPNPPAPPTSPAPPPVSPVPADTKPAS